MSVALIFSYDSSSGPVPGEGAASTSAGVSVCVRGEPVSCAAARVSVGTGVVVLDHLMEFAPVSLDINCSSLCPEIEANHHQSNVF